MGMGTHLDLCPFQAPQGPKWQPLRGFLIFARPDFFLVGSPSAGCFPSQTEGCDNDGSSDPGEPPSDSHPQRHSSTEGTADWWSPEGTLVRTAGRRLERAVEILPAKKADTRAHPRSRAS